MTDLVPEVHQADSEDDLWFEVFAGPARRVGEFGIALAWMFFLVLTVAPPSGVSWVPWLTIPLGFLGTFHFLRRAFDASPRLVVNAEGITDRTSFLGKELRVPWKQVASVSQGGFNGVVYLKIRDLRALEKTASMGRRIDLLFRRLLRKDVVPLSPTMLGINYSDLARRLTSTLFEMERAEIKAAVRAQGIQGAVPGRNNAIGQEEAS